MDASDTTIRSAGKSVSVPSQAIMTPAAMKRPNTWTGGIGVRANARNPTTVVTLVKAIGPANSSNTVALAKLATDAGCPRVFRVNSADEIPDDVTGTVGVTAGASAPEELVEAVIARLDPAEGVNEIRITDEDEYFPPPRNLRDLLSAIDGFATLALGGPAAGGSRPNDRQLQASDVLANLHS